MQRQSGDEVILVDDQPELGGQRDIATIANDRTPELVARLRAHAADVEIISRRYCFGMYEGNLLGVLQPIPHAEAAERLIHLRAGASWSPPAPRKPCCLSRITTCWA